MNRLTITILLTAVLMAFGCSDDDGVSAMDDAGDACAAEPALGCPCDMEGEVVCRTGVPEPDLRCTGGSWGASADGPCPGLDAGP